MPIKIFGTAIPTYIHKKDNAENIPWRNSFLYSIINPNNDYNEYLVLDASEYLAQVFQHFFSKKCYVCKFSHAKKYWCQQQNHFVDAA